MKTLWNKIKLIIAGRKVATDLLNIKSKWKEPTFWVAILGNGLSALAAYKGLVPAEYTKFLIIGNAVLGSAYNYVRGIQKSQTDGVKPYGSASEMWVGLATMANNAMLDMQSGGVATATLAATTVVLGHAIAAARDLSNMRPKESLDAGIPPADPNAGK